MEASTVRAGRVTAEIGATEKHRNGTFEVRTGGAPPRAVSGSKSEKGTGDRRGCSPPLSREADTVLATLRHPADSLVPGERGSMAALAALRSTIP
mmetsp:Transcript_4570/g.11069  ORF Transcript_4570/g.11069 Transcript_4570/m.11069 type:complete len:95 (+) Transcript_4570:582-866(+)